MTPTRKSFRWQDKIRLAIEIIVLAGSVMVYIFDLRADVKVQTVEINNLKTQIAMLNRSVTFLNQMLMKQPGATP